MTTLDKLDYYFSNFKWWRRYRKGTWYKHKFTKDALELTLTGTFWASYGDINRYSKVIKVEHYEINNKQMKKEDKLKIITDNIRQKLPRLMELEEGCLIRDKEIDVIYIITGRNNRFKLLFVNENRCLPSSSFKRRFEVIGKEPMLTDVLEWLGTELYTVFTYGLEVYGSDEVYMFTLDLSKPYLKDQSNEVIDFLYNLIENANP